MSDLNEVSLEDIKRTIRQGLDNLPGNYKYQQGQKQGGKYYSPGLTPLLPIEALGAGFKTPEEYKKKHGEYPSGYSKPPRRLDPSNTVPAGSMNISPKGSDRRKEVEAQIKRDNAARKSNPAPAPTPAPAPKPAPKPEPKPKGLDLDTMRQYGGYGYDNTLTNTDNIYRQMKRKYNKESYDVVLEYLLSEGHAETLEEANYVMMQMTSEHLKDIVEAYVVTLADKKGNTKAYQNYKAGMKSKIDGKPLYVAAPHLKGV